MARSLGWLDPDAMLAAMPAKLWAEWRAYYAIDPWDEERSDLRMGIICSTMDACHRVKGQVQAPIAFMPFSKRDKPKESKENTAAMKAAFHQAAAGFRKA